MWTPYINIIPEVDDGDNLNTYYGECEWCGKTKQVCSSPVGSYCKDCFELTISECESALAHFNN